MKHEVMGKMTKKRREPGRMPQEIRLAYGKIISLMLAAAPQTEPMGVVALYQALQELNLRDKDRRVILEFILSPDTDAETLCRILMATELEEERNLLRFTLLEDLYRTMMADHHESDVEVSFLVHVARLLDVRQEHLDQIRLIHAGGNIYLPRLSSIPFRSRLARQSAAALIGMAVPLGLVAAAGEFGLTPKGINRGLQALSLGRRKDRDILTGLAITLVMGAAAWRSARWLLYLPEWRQEWLLRRIRKNSCTTFRQIEKDLERDIQMLTKLVQRRAHDFLETDSWHLLLQLLHRSRSLACDLAQERKPSLSC